MLKATAKIVYDPMPGTKYFEKNWMLATTNFDFIKLYNWFCKKKGIDLDIGTPYNTHISAVRGERIPRPEHWKYKNGKIITFEYWPLPRGDNDKHIWIDVYSDELNEIREKLGLVPRKRFHITIGRLL